MSSNAVRPPVADLVFQLYGRPLHPELFDIGATRRVTHGAYALEVRLTRTGHVITWRNAAVLLSEVTAAAGQEMPARRRLLNHRFHFEQCTGLDCAHGIRYHATFQVETLTSAGFALAHDEIRRDGARRGFLHEFAACEDGRPALGFVCADFRPGCLFLTGFHTFPAERTVVKTQSLIEKAE